MKKKRYCPCCGYELNDTCWRGDTYCCATCGLTGERRQTLDTPDIRAWTEGYDEDYLDKTGVAVMTYPEALNLVGLDGFRENVWHITDEEGMSLYGRFSYVYNREWYRNLK